MHRCFIDLLTTSKDTRLFRRIKALQLWPPRPRDKVLPKMSASDNSLAVLLPEIPSRLVHTRPKSLMNLPAEVRMRTWLYSMSSERVEEGWEDWGRRRSRKAVEWRPINSRLSTLLLNRTCFLEASVMPEVEAHSARIFLHQGLRTGAFASLRGLDNASLLFKRQVGTVVCQQTIRYLVPGCNDNARESGGWASVQATIIWTHCEMHLRRRYRGVHLESDWRTMVEHNLEKSQAILTLRFSVTDAKPEVSARDEVWADRILARRPQRRHCF